jgi:hypothetical protein
MTLKIIASVLLLTPCLPIAGCRLANSHASPLETIWETMSPVRTPGFSPRVTPMKDGSALLTWLEPETARTAALRYSLRQGGAWSAPGTIVTGQPFSRHPSESPGVIALSKTNLIAYWSQRPPNEKIPSQEVDVYFSISTDRGVHWTAPTLANQPGTGEESSYPSAAPLDDKRAALIWLDGANWKKQKRVTLMSRTVQSDGSATQAAVIDQDTCTCCPTSLVQAGSGLLAAYRGHASENIRDISLLRNVDGRWSQPSAVHVDHWHFAGCPVNGPHLDANQERAVITWFTAAQDQPAVNLAFSDNGGANFSAPIRVDQGNAIGRAQVALLPGRSAAAFWLEHLSGTTRLLARTVHQDGVMETAIEITRSSDLGYPHAARLPDGILITWAEGDPVRRVHLALLPFTGHKGEQ